MQAKERGCGMSQIEVVRFHGDEIQAVHEGERVWVVEKRMCEVMGIDHDSQRKRLSDHERSPWAVTAMMTATGPDGRSYEMFCLDLDSLPMWLATIEVKRARAESRAKLIDYQRECARVLRDHFFGPRVQAEKAQAVLLETLVGQQSQMLVLMRTIIERQTDLEKRVCEIERPSFSHGAISRGSYDQLRSYVRRIATTEASVSKWKSPRAATADIHRELREATGWGGKAKPWHLLPAQLEQPAMAVLRRRLCDAERLVGSRQGHLMFGMGQRLS